MAISEPVREAIRRATRWIPALDTDGDLRDGAEICEITGQVPADGHPHGTRFILRRERPRPGAQLFLFDTIEGMRHQVMATHPGRRRRHPTWKPATAPTPASKTASAPAKTVASAVYRPASSPSTQPGWNSH
jgi:hypothetical protein